MSDDDRDDTGVHVLQLVEMSAPSTTRPRLSDEYEQILARVELAHAGAYAQMESATFKTARLRGELEKGRLDGNEWKKV